MNNLIILFSIIAIGCTFLFSSIPDSEAKLWDYIIDVEFLENPISQEKNPIVTGIVVDHAYKPVSQAKVKVTFAGESYVLITDMSGEFGKQFDANKLKPRTYTVQILVTSDDGKKGMTRTSLQIDGHTEKSAKYDRQIEFMEIANDPSKLRKNSNDPISEILFQHYLELQEKAAYAQYEEKLLDIRQQKIREIRQIVNDDLMKELDERLPYTRQFDESPKSSEFLESLDDEKRYLFELQMNSTKIRFVEAQNLIQTLLNNGTSYDQARIAYFDHLSITQEEMNSYTKNIENNKFSKKPSTNSTEN
tara:strand:- start:309 stop:1223 length:915 start_codon:yes stop_codon:yes gene_type:complete